MTGTLVKNKTIPPYFFLGMTLILVSWYASWTHWGFLGEYAFFPQWFGYILAVDALVAIRKGSSILTRAPREFVALFIVSAPVWWLFEGLNNFVLNWHYVGAEIYPVWKIIVLATVSFSTVMPAVFETTELVSTFHFVERWRNWQRVHFSHRELWLAMYLGAFGFALIVLAPQIGFLFTWTWLVLLIEPINYLRGRDSLLARIERGDWRLVVALALAGLMCGFFWEMWNFYALPKWHYTVPYVGFAKIFEMPALGYGGYVPFAWELYALYQFICGVLRRPPILLRNFN